MLRTLLALLLLTALAACDRDPASDHAQTQGKATTPRPAFTLADADGQMHDVSEWDGKVLVVNFWATWCPPCRREIPTFVSLQKEYGERGLQFVGLSMDEPQQVRDFAATLGINYPLLVGDDAVAVAASAYGNREGLLPFSAVVNRQGQVVYTQAGELTREQAEAVILPLL